MRFAVGLKQKPSADDWQWKFAWLPTRISATQIVWLESYQRRLHTVSEGNWAGGWRARYHYANAGGLWEGPEFGD